MRRMRAKIAGLAIILTLLTPKPAKADLWGGDLVFLAQLVVNAIQQLIQLKNILSTGKDTISFMRDINKGIRDGLAIIRIINPKFNPGLYGNMETAERVLSEITILYGKIPRTSESRLQEAQDRSVAESIAMNGTLFRYADQVDSETKRILDHAQVVNPQGAAKLTAQAVGVLIGVNTQVLRTNSMMLRMMGENMALSNRREKLQSEHFLEEYQGLSSALSKLPSDPKLTPLNKSQTQ
jgi:hypothetical protein